MYSMDIAKRQERLLCVSLLLVALDFSASA